MYRIRKLNQFKLPYCLLLLCCFTLSTHAASTDIALAVWANEAIVTTYTFDFEHFLAEEKEIAKYFTAKGWIDYTRAMTDSKLPETIQKNSYYVSAVATMPPTIKKNHDTTWEVTMPILVIYKNPAYTQKQNVLVSLTGIRTTKEGVRGYAISSLRASVITDPCRCAKKELSAAIA